MSDTVLIASSTYRLTLTAKKNGVAWDLSAAVVRVFLQSPTGTTLTRTATVDAPASAGLAHYDTLTTDLTTAGVWLAQWNVVDGTITQDSLPERLLIVGALA